MKTFAEEILHFSESVDFLTAENVESLKKLTIPHLVSRFRAAAVEVCLETRIAGKHGNVGLKYDWFSGGQPPDAHNLFQDNGDKKEYYGQTSYAFDKNLDLWIVARDGGTLADAKDSSNLVPGSNQDGIPRFVPYAGNVRIKTSIIRPLIRREKPCGVLNIELEHHAKFSEDVFKEIGQLRDAVGILIELGEVSKANLVNTRTAIARLEEIAKNRNHLYFMCREAFKGEQFVRAKADRLKRLVTRGERRGVLRSWVRERGE